MAPLFQSPAFPQLPLALKSQCLHLVTTRHKITVPLLRGSPGIQAFPRWGCGAPRETITSKYMALYIKTLSLPHDPCCMKFRYFSNLFSIIVPRCLINCTPAEIQDQKTLDSSILQMRTLESINEKSLPWGSHSIFPIKPCSTRVLEMRRGERGRNGCR